MAHQQTNCDVFPTLQRQNTALDPSTAQQDLLQGVENYKHQRYVSVQQMANETVLLLRSLSQRLQRFQARTHGFIKTPRPRNATDQETTDHHHALMSPVSPAETGRSVFAHTTNDGNSLPARRSTATEEDRPQVSLPVPDTTTSEIPRKPTVRKTYSQNMSAQRDAYSEPTYPWDGHTQDNPQLIRNNYPDICRMTYTDGTMPLSERPDRGLMSDIDRASSAVREGIAAEGQQEIPKHTTLIDDNDRQDVLAVQRTPSYHTKSAQPPNTFRSQDTIAGKCKEPNGHITQSSDSDIQVFHERQSTTTHCEQPTHVGSTTMPSGKNRRAHPLQQLADRSTSDSEAKPGAKHTHGQRHTTTKSYPMLSREEPFTN